MQDEPQPHLSLSPVLIDPPGGILDSDARKNRADIRATCVIVSRPQTTNRVCAIYHHLSIITSNHGHGWVYEPGPPGIHRPRAKVRAGQMFAAYSRRLGSLHGPPESSRSLTPGGWPSLLNGAIWQLAGYQSIPVMSPPDSPFQFVLQFVVILSLTITRKNRTRFSPGGHEAARLTMTLAERNKGTDSERAKTQQERKRGRLRGSEKEKSKNIKTFPRWAKSNFGKIGRIRYSEQARVT
ncbi:hypothetical protein BDV93DRAFT_542695 [Ceratobasidium sp. AG-I]|nr:hypothetical protein BDV93DRAFT_542695 [Ceratobasidium sp. AG-I]